VVDFFGLFHTVHPMLAMKSSTSMTTRKSSGRGISRNLRPSHQLKWKPMTAVTPVTTKAMSCTHASFGHASSRSHSSGMIQYAAPMKPASSHITNRLVCVARAVLNGIH
jgi:hypothetical protein